MNEQYLTVAEVAEMLDVSRDTVRRMFAEEPGVVEVGARRRRTSRPYRILRIPQGVLERVLARRAVKGYTTAGNESEAEQGGPSGTL